MEKKCVQILSDILTSMYAHTILNILKGLYIFKHSKHVHLIKPDIRVLLLHGVAHKFIFEIYILLQQWDKKHLLVSRCLARLGIKQVCEKTDAFKNVRGIFAIFITYVMEIYDYLYEV